MCLCYYLSFNTLTSLVDYDSHRLDFVQKDSRQHINIAAIDDKDCHVHLVLQLGISFKAHGTLANWH